MHPRISYNGDDLILDDDKEEDGDTRIHDEDEVIRKEKSVVGTQLIEMDIKKTLQVALPKKQSNCNGITGTTESAIELKKKSEIDLVKQLEKRNLTAEHGMGTENSNKRKRPAPKLQQESIANQYKHLFENWNPPSLQSDNFDLDDNQLWLFQRKPKQGRVEETKVGSNNETISGSSSALWPPRAQYLPNVDMYALPYTVPF